MSQCRTKEEHPITVLIADDHPLMRRALRNLFADQPDIKVIGEVSNGSDAVRVALECLPLVVILDVSMPGLNGIEAAEKISAICPQVSILALSVHDEDALVRRMIEAGAKGYVTKEALDEQVVRAVRTVASGGVALDGTVLSRVLKADVPDRAAPSGESGLVTGRELRVLRLLALGLTNSQIASECGLSTRTVRGYLESLFSKFGVGNRTAAVSVGIHLGILTVEDVKKISGEG